MQKNHLNIHQLRINYLENLNNNLLQRRRREKETRNASTNSQHDMRTKSNLTLSLLEYTISTQFALTYHTTTLCKHNTNKSLLWKLKYFYIVVCINKTRQNRKVLRSLLNIIYKNKKEKTKNMEDGRHSQTFMYAKGTKGHGTYTTLQIIHIIRNIFKTMLVYWWCPGFLPVYSVCT